MRKKEDILNEINQTVKEGMRMIREKKEGSKCCINMDKLAKYAEGIALLDIDYGLTYVNEEENKICICVGDSNPFDMEQLENQIPYEVCAKGGKCAEMIDIEIDCEWTPNTSEGDWKCWKGGKWTSC